MLSAQEREWLERRKNPCNRCGFFNRCSWKFQGVKCEEGGLFEVKAWGMKNYEVKNNYRDAAKFEALVAVKLAQNEHRFVPCYKSEIEWNDCPHEEWDCDQCLIKYARLAVEAEMDGDENE